MNTQSITTWALKVSFIFILSAALPAAAHAAVSINEVMYNPQGTDAGREWVELYNSGSIDVTLVGGSGKGSWRIVDSSNHTIVDPAGGVGRGSLVIPAGGYLVIATDPAVFVGEFSGDYSVAKSSLSLNNTGITVSLVDDGGATVSSFAYTASMGGNDDTTSLQKSADTWLQAMPTPGAANATEAYVPPADESGSSSSSSSKSSSTPNPGYIAPPLPQVFADAGESRTVIVGAGTKFVATAYDRDRDVINYAKFFWNFGDGSTAEGPWVMHHFGYPGRYAVELTVTNTSIRSTSRITVTAEPASVAFALLPQGGVSIKNNSGRELDLSFWVVKQGENVFTLPELSVVLKGAAINISAATLGFSATDAKLNYPDGTEVVPEPELVSTEDIVPVPEIAVSDEAPVIDAPLITPVVSMEMPATFVSGASSTPEVPETSVPIELPAAVATSEATLPLWTALAGLSGIMGLGVASVWAVRRKPVTTPEAEEFTIE